MATRGKWRGRKSGRNKPKPLPSVATSCRSERIVGTPPPFAAAYADVLPETHREALRNAAITYLDDCFSTIADGEPGQSHADTPIGSYRPSRYE